MQRSSGLSCFSEPVPAEYVRIRRPSTPAGLLQREIEPEAAVKPGNTLGIRKFRFDTAEGVDGQARP